MPRHHNGHALAKKRVIEATIASPQSRKFWPLAGLSEVELWQRKKLTLRQSNEKKWFVYGNHGPKSTLKRHKFIQGFIEHGCDYREFYKPDREVLAKVDEILNLKNPV